MHILSVLYTSNPEQCNMFLYYLLISSNSKTISPIILSISSHNLFSPSYSLQLHHPFLSIILSLVATSSLGEHYPLYSFGLFCPPLHSAQTRHLIRWVKENKEAMIITKPSVVFIPIGSGEDSGEFGC